jgi:phage-related minor tail protein
MKFFPLLIIGIFFSSLALSDECTIDLNYDIRVSSQFLEVSDKDGVVYEIRQGGDLTVKGVAVELNEQQKELAEEYAGEVAAMVPQWINLVSRALTIAEEAIRVAFSAAFGDDSAAVEKSTQALARAREKFENSSSADDGVYTIAVNSLNDVDGAFDEDFEEELEDIVMSSVGLLFVELGKTLMSSDRNFEQSMEEFGERMDRMGDELETMGDELEKTASKLCDDMEHARALEDELSDQIPELKGYRLFES